jgi:hypothetical protein
MQLLLAPGLGMHPEVHSPTHAHMQQGMQAVDTPSNLSTYSPLHMRFKDCRVQAGCSGN